MLPRDAIQLMTDFSQMSEMSQSSVQHESDTGEENGGVTESNIQDVTMENESDDEGIQTTRKRSKRMVIDDDDDDDDDDNGDAGGSVSGNSNENDHTGVEGGLRETEGDLKETSDNASAGDATRSPASKGKRPTKKKLTVDEVLSEVLRDSDKDEEAEKSDEGPGDKSDDEESEKEESQGPMKFDGDLFDAEDSSDNENDLDRAAGPEYDSAEDKSYEESIMDKPELMEKIKKLKGAAKKPRQQKSRKCKPTKDDMLALHSESQRLIRETRVSLPYHRPAPKTLQDFLARAQKKQEVYKDLKRGTLDIEKARIIQEKIVEYSVEKLPSFHHKRHSSQRKEKQSSVAESQQSLPDSGIVSSGLDTQSQDSELCEASEKHEDLAPCPVGEDELPDIEISHSHGLSDSQHTLKESESEGHSQSAQESACGVENKDSQNVSDLDEAVVEQVDSPLVAKESQSQPIEDLDSVKGDSQRSESVTDVVPESLESDMCDEVGVESEAVASALTDKSERLVKTDSKVINCEAKQSCEDDSGIENDFNKQLNASSPMKAALQKKKSADKDAVTEQASEEAGQMNLKMARQKLVEELAQKGVMPAFGKGGGDFIVLEEGSKDVPVKEKKSNIDRLLERLMHHYPKKETKKSKNVEISIVEQTGEGQKKELKLKTVTYRTEGEPDLDLSSIARISGNRLQALKQKLEVGMRKKRVAAYERRQQLYKMENEEGYEEKAEEDGLPAEEEEAELTDGSDTEEEEEEEEEMDLVEEKEDRNNPFLDDEAEDDEDDDDYDDSPRQSPVCAEINDMKEDEEDLFQDPDRLQLRLDESDEEEDDNQESDEEKETKEETDGLGPGRMSQRGTQRLLISDDEDGSQLQSAQDPTKTCDPNIAGNLVKDSLDLSFEMLTPMSRLLQDTQPSSSLPSTQPVEDSQDLCDSPMSQILDADGYFRVPSSQPRRSAKPALLMEGSQDAGDDHMDMLVGLCSGQFAEAGEGAMPSSGGFEGLFDNSSQSQDDRGSLTSLFDSSSQSQHAIQRDSLSEGDSMSRSDIISKGHLDAERAGESVDMSQGRLSLKSANSKSLAASESQKDKGSDREDSMAEALRLSSGAFPSSEFQDQSQSQDGKKRGVKRRLIIQDDSSDEEGEGGSNRFLLLSDDEGTKGSDKNELSESDEEDHDSEMEEPSSFRGFKDKGKILQQFVENEAELSGSEAESDENLDLEEEEDYMEVEAGDQDHLNEDQLRDQVGRVHMKQMLDDDDRQLMRYKEMYLPDGDLYSEGGGRQRRFHWKHLGDDESQNDLFAHPSDEEKDEGEDPDEKQWRMERYEREKFLESQQQENVTADREDENSQFMKFGQFFMKRQVSDPAPSPQQPTLTKPKLARSQSVVDKSSPGKFLKPKIPKRGSFLARSKENLARIAEITKAAGLNVNGTRGSRSFVFSVNSSDKGDEGSKEQLLNNAAAKASAVKKITPHKPPAKKKCVQPAPKPQTQNSIFKLL